MSKEHCTISPRTLLPAGAETAKSLKLVLLEEAKSPEFCRPNSQEKIQNFADQIPKQKSRIW